MQVPPTPRHPATESSGAPKRNPKTASSPASTIMKHFKYDHLPKHLQVPSKSICDIAVNFDERLPESAEKEAGLRKLLEAKDCLVRAYLEFRNV